MVSERIDQYEEILKARGLFLDKEQFEKLDLYVLLLTEWNEKINLMSRRKQQSIWSNHILHSLSPLFEIEFPAEMFVADIGSGGGLPAIPLSIAMQHTKFVLIESIRKKCLALEDMINRLELPNARVVNVRAEDLSGTKGFGHSFDLVVARAVAPLGQLIRWSTPLIRKGKGLELTMPKADPPRGPVTLPALLAMKGGDLEPEILEARKGTKFRSLQNIPISFDGIKNTTLVDKYLVVVAL